MKSHSFFPTWLVITGVLFAAIGCNKEDLSSPVSKPPQEEKTAPKPKSGQSSCTTAFGKIEVSNGMLCFKDSVQFLQVYECLEDKKDSYNDAWEADHAGWTDEQIQGLEDSIGFSEDQPLIDFEHELDFTSLRKTIEDQIVVWLNNPVLDENNDPDDHPVVDEELRTLLSPDCKVCIGGTVYDFCDLGGPSTAAGEVGNRSSMLCIGGCCTFGDSKDFFTFPTDPTQKFKVKVSLKNFPIVLHLAQAKMVSYKLRSNGNSWKRTKNLKEVRVTGDGRNGLVNGCTILGPVNTFKIKRRRHLACRFKEWGPPTIYAMDNDIFGTGIINNFNGTSATIPLIMF